MSAARKAATAAATSNPWRRSMIGKIHVAKHQLRMAEDDYRSLLLEKAGVTSSKEATSDGLTKVMEEMRRLGFQDLPKVRAVPPSHNRGPGKADNPSVRKARALWLSLYQLGEVRDARESALQAFAARQLKVDRMQWADQALCYRLIEALKAMAQRNGWDQHLEEYERANAPIILKRRLVVAILAKLKAASAVGSDWTVEQAMDRLFGETFDRRSPESLELAAVSLGGKLREVRS